MSMSLPNPSQPRRSKTILSPDSQTAKFLYTIIKQLDLKTIDWNDVASQLDITNGHAARMRYSRFRSQIDENVKDTKPKPRASDGKDLKVRVNEKEKRKREGTVDVLSKREADRESPVYILEDENAAKRIKLETRQDVPVPRNAIKTEAVDRNAARLSSNIKTEPETSQPRIHHPTVTAYTVPIPDSTESKPAISTEETAITKPRPGSVLQTAQPSMSSTQSDSRKAPHMTPSQGNARMQPPMQSRMQYQQYPYATQKYSHPYYPQPAFQPVGSYVYPSYPAVNTQATYYPSQYPHQQQPRQQYQQPHYGQMPRQTQSNMALQHGAPYLQTSNPTSTSRELAAAASYPWPYSESVVQKQIKPIDSIGNNLILIPEVVPTPNVVSGVAEFNTDINFDFLGAGLGGDFSEWVSSGDILPTASAAQLMLGNAVEQVVNDTPTRDVINAMVRGTNAVTKQPSNNTLQPAMIQPGGSLHTFGGESRTETPLKDTVALDSKGLGESFQGSMSAQVSIPATSPSQAVTENGIRKTAQTLAQTHISAPLQPSTTLLPPSLVSLDQDMPPNDAQSSDLAPVQPQYRTRDLPLPHAAPQNEQLTTSNPQIPTATLNDGVEGGTEQTKPASESMSVSLGTNAREEGTVKVKVEAGLEVENL